MTRDTKDLPDDLLDHASNMTLFGRDVRLTIGGVRVPLEDFSFAFAPSKIDDVETISLTSYTTTFQIDPADLVSDEMNEAMAKMWAEIWERRFMDEMLGRPSEYEQSLRAAGAKV